ncbi:ArpU family phage packaging/lysis transcriptional regulator [Ligilactobacillus salivarius]|uniref:ArpU family phage packaging/lysis transcriptional regulator n=1 Tax=Ligilactobacillus salivarius TaxID=1624 RepID=UPI0030FCD863
MQLSDLLDNNDNREIDLSKTRIKVTNFMENQYQQLKYLANTSPLQSVSYDNVRVKTSPSNSIEDKTIRQLQAKEYIRIIDDCINSLDDIQSKIFRYKLLEHRTEYVITELTGYGRSQIYNIFKYACREFAKQLRLVTDIDLLEYKE